MTMVSVGRRNVAARMVVPVVFLLAACGGDRATSPGPVTPPPDQPPPGVVAARYALTSANGQSLPAEVYAGVYQDESTGWFHDLRIVATDGYVDLHDDGTFAQFVTMRTMVDGQLAATPRYVDYGRWFAVPHSDQIRFESAYRQWPGVFHGVAGDGTVRMTQELTGGEAGAGVVAYEYRRASLQ